MRKLWDEEKEEVRTGVNKTGTGRRRRGRAGATSTVAGSALARSK